MNRLAKETSPYLLQHQHNPVDWYPWGLDAFECARRENKPIFLSVGYSTCYWCHVMERQCFEVEAVAAEMNSRFINIKVDREERPDVDQLYMTAVQILTRHGGWPMSVWLTPDLRPFYAGTYFPPPKFLQILAGLDEAWTERRAEVEQSTEQIVNYLKQLAKPPAPRGTIRIDHDYIEGLLERIVADYDPVHGGFGDAPKFPRETELELLLVHNRLRPNPARMRMVHHTLHAMAEGGIRDQLGGGFHRYSTDAQWLVPHFEIMLYDNAMLGWVYAEAFAQSGEAAFANIARGIFDFILREMTSPSGLFYTALDAEVDGREGQNYLWTSVQIEGVLGDVDAKLFNQVYGVDRGPNFADPHHGGGVASDNILYLPRPMSRVAADLGTTEAALDAQLAPMRQKLKDARGARKQPLLDTKIITSWNALMIRALAHGGRVLSESRYIEAAGSAAVALLHDHRMPDGGLYRTSRDGAAEYPGFLDDYAFLAQASLALLEAGAAGDWKKLADELIEQTIAKFGDPSAGGFYFTESSATDLIVRQKTGGDSPLPSGNAIAAMVLLSTGKVEEARKTIGLFAQSIESQAEAMSSMVQAVVLFLRDHPRFEVSAGSNPDSPIALSPAERAQDVVSASADWENPTRLRIQLNIQPPYHIHSNEAASGGVPMIPTRITVEGATEFSIDYPAPTSAKFPFADEPISVYQGEVEIVITARPRDANLPLRLRLTYQACDEESCLPPVTKTFEVSRQS